MVVASVSRAFNSYHIWHNPARNQIETYQTHECRYSRRDSVLKEVIPVNFSKSADFRKSFKQNKIFKGTDNATTYRPNGTQKTSTICLVVAQN